eukprot:gb/GECG01011276.1/.p1 GENE.gb/GECG01011276.1/~~gb/GECG01011276.1/.p1  ORF type:complete len:115 (+),score=6.11 gb/GECG01011276.1/:1-345(+)
MYHGMYSVSANPSYNTVYEPCVSLVHRMMPSLLCNSMENSGALTSWLPVGYQNSPSTKLKYAVNSLQHTTSGPMLELRANRSDDPSTCHSFLDSVKLTLCCYDQTSAREQRWRL